MTRTRQLLWLALACLLTVASVLALGQFEHRSGAQEAPTCDHAGTCLIPPLVIDCDEHAGTGCPPPAQPVPAPPAYTG